jgi:hypothetical protein
MEFRLRLASGHGPGVVVGPGTNNPNVFAQQFHTSPRVQYKVAAQAQAVGKADAKGAIQINWFDSHGAFISASNALLDVSPQFKRFEHIVTAPAVQRTCVREKITRCGADRVAIAVMLSVPDLACASSAHASFRRT